MNTRTHDEPAVTAVRPEAGDTPAYAWYIVAVLTAAYLLSLVDRILIGLLIEPIKSDLALGDTQIGLLVGFGFVFFYATLGIPLGSLADSSNRRNLIFAGIVVWSLATAGCGLATGFSGLLLARMLVGAGEAVLFPCAISTFSDRFPRAKLGMVMSIFSFGALAGMGLAMAGGGELMRWTATTDSEFTLLGIALHGWRLVFFVVGCIGLPLAALILLTVREAPRLHAPPVPPSMRELVQAVASQRRAFFGLFAGFGAQVLSTYIPMTWAAPFYLRTFGMNAQTVGWALGAIFTLAGGLGLLVGGKWSDARAAHGIIDAPVQILLLSIPMQLPLIALVFAADSAAVSLAALGGLLFVASLYGGLQGTTVRLMSPPGMQGRLMAIYLFVVTIFGMGCGPLAVGALSENVFAGERALGGAMAVVMASAIVVAAGVLLFARPAMRSTMLAIRDQETRTRSLRAASTH